MLLSATRLRVRLAWHMPAFLWQTFRSNRQVSRSQGFRAGRLLVDAHRTFWTLTAWEDERSMKAFRGSGAHSQVMPRLFQWCDEAAYAHWMPAEEKLADWTEARAPGARRSSFPCGTSVSRSRGQALRVSSPEAFDRTGNKSAQKIGGLSIRFRDPQAARTTSIAGLLRSSAFHFQLLGRRSLRRRQSRRQHAER
jgi:hypothetical protein